MREAVVAVASLMELLPTRVYIDVEYVHALYSDLFDDAPLSFVRR